MDHRPVWGLPGQELGLCKHVHCNPKQGRVLKPTNATTRMIEHKTRSSLIYHSTCFLMGEHTNLMGEQYVREHFDYSENKKNFWRSDIDNKMLWQIV